MRNKSMTTRQNICAAGKKEFLAKGFRAASLRNIVKEAGVTTGAFYGYFKSKEELFDALVREAAEVFMEQFKGALRSFASLPPTQQQGQLGKISGECMMWMVDYMYDHLDTFKLLLCCAEGTKYENFIHSLVELETDATHRFIDVLTELGHEVTPINSQLEHILVSGFFSGFFEIVVHDMEKENAVLYTQELREFYTAGWQKIMGL